MSRVKKKFEFDPSEWATFAWEITLICEEFYRFWFGGILGLDSMTEFPVSLSIHVGFTSWLLYSSTHRSLEGFFRLEASWVQDGWLQWSYENWYFHLDISRRHNFMAFLIINHEKKCKTAATIIFPFACLIRWDEWQWIHQTFLILWEADQVLRSSPLQQALLGNRCGLRRVSTRWPPGLRLRRRRGSVHQPLPLERRGRGTDRQQIRREEMGCLVRERKTRPTLSQF